MKPGRLLVRSLALLFLMQRDKACEGEEGWCNGMHWLPSPFASFRFFPARGWVFRESKRDTKSRGQQVEEKGIQRTTEGERERETRSLRPHRGNAKKRRREAPPPPPPLLRCSQSGRKANTKGPAGVRTKKKRWRAAGQEERLLLLLRRRLLLLWADPFKDCARAVGAARRGETPPTVPLSAHRLPVRLQPP